MAPLAVIGAKKILVVLIIALRNVEIVLVGSDKTEEAYEKYRSQQPWSAIRFDDEIRMNLQDEFNVKTIPSLIFLDTDENVVSHDGRKLVEVAAFNEYTYQAVEWVASELGVSTVSYDSDSSYF
ncbi:unnamed protein product [Phytophthora fragariaefolia]|uniref:protein-disulfide reductase n=1 Tax=Phytophthora fragariaefolia TaxID=1490495 RepID=A0A9W6Y563_9STRA|nr:unnamed protein product [Phytophthora fragariaefolia]